MKKCPYCGEEIQPAALICRYCDRDLRSDAQRSLSTKQASPVNIGTTSSKKPRIAIAVALFAIILLLASTQFTLFVVQPIGAAPDGRTLLIARPRGSKFVDSADAMCERIQGGVNLICRAMVMGEIGKNATIYVRLPYSETLYLMSTGGTKYDR